MLVWVFMFFMLNMDKGLLGPVWNGWLVASCSSTALGRNWPNDDLQLCSSSCALRCQHGLELLGQWMEPCMALVWCSSTWSSTRLHGGTSTTSTFLKNGCQHTMEDGRTQNALLKEQKRIKDSQDSHVPLLF
uniref:Secreted protein n=1 Tax=Meloidogyne incognita TaxID=6306 RepID=A0A914KQ45_MELIC